LLSGAISVNSKRVANDLAFVPAPSESVGNVISGTNFDSDDDQDDERTDFDNFEQLNRKRDKQREKEYEKALREENESGDSGIEENPLD